MRIAIVHWSCRQVGGAESYLAVVLPALARRGHELAMVVEMDLSVDRDPLPLPPHAPVWSVAELGLEAAVARLREWSPDVVLTQITLDPALEAAVQSVAPAVFFAAAYYGTCISGSKLTRFPHAEPCARVFGPACLLRFYPLRCGGLNPLTMIRDYRRQASRQQLLAGYRYVLTNSTHMRDEYLRHGVDPERVSALRLPIPEVDSPPADDRPIGPREEYTLLFAGRMDPLKGAEIAVDALPGIRRLLEGRIRLVMIGDGPERETLEQRAGRIRDEGIQVDFTGWLGQAEIRDWMRRSDLLLVPSIWPEPFGLVGPEAGMMRLPSVAFDVGGISDWLEEGINGHFARGKRHTAGPLSNAVYRALADPQHHMKLRHGARRLAERFTVAGHVEELEGFLSRAADASLTASHEETS